MYVNVHNIFPKLTLLLKLSSSLSLTKYMRLFLCIKTALLQYIHILFPREKHELMLFRQIFTISSDLSSRRLFHLTSYSPLSCIHFYWVQFLINREYFFHFPLIDHAILQAKHFDSSISMFLNSMYSFVWLRYNLYQEGLSWFYLLDVISQLKCNYSSIFHRLFWVITL